MKRIKFFVFFLTLFAAVSACKSKKEKVTAEVEKLYNETNLPATDIATADPLPFQQPHLQFNQLSMRCKVDYDDGVFRQDFIANFRIQKDSLIWLSLTGPFNIEGARLLVRKDSFFLLNKLTREYTARPVNELRQMIPLGAGFDALQNLLLGQIVDIGPSTRSIYEADSFWVINFQNAQLRQMATVHRLNYTTTELMLADQMVKQDMIIKFGNYKDLSGIAFPFQRFIEVNREAQKMKLKMEVQRYTINEPLTFPFEVNENYKRNEK